MKRLISKFQTPYTTIKPGSYGVKNWQKLSDFKDWNSKDYEFVNINNVKIPVMNMLNNVDVVTKWNPNAELKSKLDANNISKDEYFDLKQQLGREPETDDYKLYNTFKSLKSNGIQRTPKEAALMLALSRQIESNVRKAKNEAAPYVGAALAIPAVICGGAELGMAAAEAAPEVAEFFSTLPKILTSAETKSAVNNMIGYGLATEFANQSVNTFSNGKYRSVGNLGDQLIFNGDFEDKFGPFVTDFVGDAMTMGFANDVKNLATTAYHYPTFRGTLKDAVTARGGSWSPAAEAKTLKYAWNHPTIVNSFETVGTYPGTTTLPVKSNITVTQAPSTTGISNYGSSALSVEMPHLLPEVTDNTTKAATQVVEDLPRTISIGDIGTKIRTRLVDDPTLEFTLVKDPNSTNVYHMHFRTGGYDSTIGRRTPGTLTLELKSALFQNTLDKLPAGSILSIEDTTADQLATRVGGLNTGSVHGWNSINPLATDQVTMRNRTGLTRLRAQNPHLVSYFDSDGNVHTATVSDYYKLTPEEIAAEESAEIPVITKDNAALMSDESWYRAFENAKGNPEEMLRLKALHFKTNYESPVVDETGMPVKTYSTVAKLYDPNYTVYDTNIEGKPSAIYSTNNRKMSESYFTGNITSEDANSSVDNAFLYYSKQLEELQTKMNSLNNLKAEAESNGFADEYFMEEYNEAYSPLLLQYELIQLKIESARVAAAEEASLNTSRVKTYYLNHPNEVVVEGQGHPWDNLIYLDTNGEWQVGSTNTAEETFRDSEVGGIKFKDIRDYGPNIQKAEDNNFATGDVYTTYDPRNTKLADPITYFKEGDPLIGQINPYTGKVIEVGDEIPLPWRDNPSNPDMRFSFNPFVKLAEWITGEPNERVVLQLLDLEMVDKLIQQAIDYRNSDIYKLTLAENNAEARELGFLGENDELKISSPNEYPEVKLEPIYSAGKTYGTYDPETNTILIDPDLIRKRGQWNTPYHEGLHSLRISESSDPKTLKFLEYKTEQALLYNAPKEIRKPYELSTHMHEVGKTLGIEDGLAYPGDMVAQETLQKAIQEKSWCSHLKAAKNPTSENLKIFWKLINGTYMPCLFIGAGITAAIKKNRKGGKLTKIYL